MEWHEDLTRCDRFSDAQFDVADAAAARHDVDLVLRLQPEHPCIPRVHLDPGVRRQALEDRHLAGLRPRMPVLDCATGIEYERKILVRLFGKRLPGRRDQVGAATLGLEDALAIETTARAGIRIALTERPLDATVLLDRVIGHARVVAQAALRHALPLVERVTRFRP